MWERETIRTVKDPLFAQDQFIRSIAKLMVSTWRDEVYDAYGIKRGRFFEYHGTVFRRFTKKEGK